MPLLSREVLTLRFILDCDGAGEDEETTECRDSQSPSLLLRLPVEIRFEILRYLLCIECNRKSHTRQPPQSSISELLYLNPRRILEAAPFKHKGNQEINGNPPTITRCQLHAAVLRTCKQLYWEGKTVLYTDNKVLAIQSGIKGLGAKLNNYGVPVLGPLPSSRLISGALNGSRIDRFRFTPLILFTGGTTKSDAPFYICTLMDALDFLHALWIMVKSPFARGMGYNLTLSTDLDPRYLRLTDSFVKVAILPWLHTNINTINFHMPTSNPISEDKPNVISDACNARLTSFRDEFTKHLLASRKESNLHLYTSICDYLERIMLQGETHVEQGNFNRAEISFERVNYEACSLVRTRTGALVDVSSRSKDGINRVCKLIAVSAYRLCELRSGSLAQLICKRRRDVQAGNKVITEAHPCNSRRIKNASKAEAEQVTEDPRSSTPEDVSPVTSNSDMRSSIGEASTKIDIEKPADPNAEVPKSVPTILEQPKRWLVLVPRTSRLEPQLARDLALTSGLLALRLPCASPVPEWNIRLDIMLLRLFAGRDDVPNAVWCIRRIHNNGTVVLNSVKKYAPCEKKWEPFSKLTQDLAQQLKSGSPRQCFWETAEKVERVVVLLWGRTVGSEERIQWFDLDI